MQPSVCQVHGASGKFLWQPGHGPSDVALVSNGRSDASGRCQGCPGTSGAYHGDSGAGGTGQRAMGCGMASLLAGRSAPRGIPTSSCLPKPEVTGICTSVPSRLGCDSAGLRKGSRHHFFAGQKRCHLASRGQRKAVLRHLQLQRGLRSSQRNQKQEKTTRENKRSLQSVFAA